jgi:hypothetical protein
MQVENMAEHYILVSYLSSVRVRSALLDVKSTVALCVAAQFHSRRQRFGPVGWMFRWA